MDAIFYTVLIVAIFYTIFSLYGWINTFYLAGEISLRSGANIFQIMSWKPIPVILDITVTIYWIWMVVRCFV